MIFVDANVLIYAEDTGQPGKQPRAASWMEFLWETGQGAISTQVLKEFYWNVTRKIRHPLSSDMAWRKMHSLHAWNPRQVDGDLIHHARQIEARFQYSWWDCLIVVAAIDQRCNILLSEDMQDGMDIDGTVIRNPFRISPEEAQELPPHPSLKQRRARYGAHR